MQENQKNEKRRIFLGPAIGRDPLKLRVRRLTTKVDLLSANAAGAAAPCPNRSHLPPEWCDLGIDGISWEITSRQWKAVEKPGNSAAFSPFCLISFCSFFGVMLSQNSIIPGTNRKQLQCGPCWPIPGGHDWVQGRRWDTGGDLFNRRTETASVSPILGDGSAPGTM